MLKLPNIEISLLFVSRLLNWVFMIFKNSDWLGG